MSQENVETVQAIYDAWSAGKLGRAYMADDIEYVNPPDALESGTLSGADSFNNVFAVYDKVQIEIEKLLDAGDKVVMVGEMRGKARATGIEMKRPHSQVWTLAEGKAIRMAWFHREKEALEAAGLSE